MATGGNPDNPNVDLTKFWEDKDIEFMANMLRGTGKFHVVPLYEEDHQMTFDEEGEEEEQEDKFASSLGANFTPKSYGDQAQTYKVVRPPTPTPRLFRPSQPRAPLLPPLPPITEDFPPFPPHPGPLRGLNPHVSFEQGGITGQGCSPPVSKGSITGQGHNPPANEGKLSNVGSKRSYPPNVHDGTFRAKPVSVKQEETTVTKTTYSPNYPPYSVSYVHHPIYPTTHSEPMNHPPYPPQTMNHPTLPPHPISHSTPHPNPINQTVVYPPSLTHAQPPHMMAHAQPTHFPVPIVNQNVVSQQQTFHYPGSDQTVTSPSVPDPYTTSVVNSSLLASSMRIPPLPPFSGENQKGDVSFEVWKYELLCIISDAIYPNALILQAIRRSLKGKAREILLTVDSTATPSDILSKLEGIYGIVSSRQILLQQFYLETQQEGESVADYSIRIENLLRRATVSTQLHESVRHEMLCSKLWNGLRDPLLKNSSRYKFDVIKDFNVLRVDLRTIEQDLVTSRHTTEETKQLQQNVLPQAQSSSTDKKIDNLLEQMKSLRSKLTSMEKKYEDACKGGKETTSEHDSASFNSFQPQGDYSSRGRGRFNHRRGRSRGRGGSGRGFFPKRGGSQTEKKDTDQKSEKKDDSKSDKGN